MTLADVITSINHAHAARLEATSKTKSARALRIESRTNELDEINEAIPIASTKKLN